AVFSTGGPKQVANPAQANTANQKTESKGLMAIVIAINPFDSVFWLAVFAWAGLATCFGPPVVLSLYWKGVTKWGAISGMIVGPIVTILWYMWPPLDIYEGGPAFLAA